MICEMTEYLMSALSWSILGFIAGTLIGPNVNLYLKEGWDDRKRT